MAILLRKESVTLLILSILFVLVGVESGAQQRRKPSRRVTNPVASPSPTPTPRSSVDSQREAEIISTAEEGLVEDPATGRTSSVLNQPARRRTVAGESDPDGMRNSVDQLSTQMSKLHDRLAAMEDEQKSLVYLERLSRAEQRAEDLRAQLRDVQSKELDYDARMEQLQNDLRPENIDMSIATFGSTRPEDIRAQRRLQLENERKRIQAQLALLDKSRTRIEAALSTADLEVDKLRERVEAIEGPLKTNAERETNAEKADTGNQQQPAPPQESPLP
jgi:predicted  nucleic acid-binding Zn-ribbon protein